MALSAAEGEGDSLLRVLTKELSAKYFNSLYIYIYIHIYIHYIIFYIYKVRRGVHGMKRIPSMVIQVHRLKRLFYTLATKYGGLKMNYLAGNLKKFSGTVTPDLTQEITLCVAAKRQNPGNIFTKGYCDCH